jgi:DNA-binding transcriptional ArsR family regulator
MTAWAKLPNAIAKGEDLLGTALSTLSWRGHRTTAIASLVILITLAIRLNQSHRGKPFPQEANETRVAVSYNDLCDLTGFAKATVCKALSLLEGMNAIRIHQQGRSNVYELLGVNKGGEWCQLPQDYLIGHGGHTKIQRLNSLPSTLIALDAMKVYFLLMVYRNSRFNTTAISYSKITKYTGIRRENIYKALSFLVAHELISVSEDSDARQDEDKSRRYKIIGLRSSGSA